MTILRPHDRFTLIRPSDRPMTVGEFLDWDGFEPGRRYQLIDGTIVMMMNSPLGAHQVLASRLAQHLWNALDGTGLFVMSPGGVARSAQATRWYEADLIVTGEALDRRYYQAPVLVAEVLSPSTEDFDRKVKLADYRTLASVQEILLIDQFRAHVELHRRPAAGEWTLTLLTGLDAVIELAAVPLRLPLAGLYRGIRLQPEPFFAQEAEGP